MTGSRSTLDFTVSYAADPPAGTVWDNAAAYVTFIADTIRGTQRIVSVNYLFGRPLIPSNFLEIILASNFRDMRNLMYVVFGLLKMSFWVR